MTDELKKLPAVFYRSPSGSEPVREWLKELSFADRRLVGQDIALVEFGWPVGMPVCRSLGDWLREVRSNLRCQPWRAKRRLVVPDRRRRGCMAGIATAREQCRAYIERIRNAVESLWAS